MTNGDKYKTAQERSEAFRSWCKSNYDADKCFSKVREHNCSRCGFDWLNLEAEYEKPLPCPFCGSECRCESFGDVNKVECQNGCACHYQSGGVMSRPESIAAHNRVAKAVMESEVNK